MSVAHPPPSLPSLHCPPSRPHPPFPPTDLGQDVFVRPSHISGGTVMPLLKDSKIKGKPILILVRARLMPDLVLVAAETRVFVVWCFCTYGLSGVWSIGGGNSGLVVSMLVAFLHLICEVISCSCITFYYWKRRRSCYLGHVLGASLFDLLLSVLFFLVLLLLSLFYSYFFFLAFMRWHPRRSCFRC